MRRVAAVLVLAAIAGHGCAKKAAPDSQAPESVAPGGAEAPAAEGEKKSLDIGRDEPLPDDIAAIEDRLARVEDELQQVGLGDGDGGDAAPNLAGEGERDRCTRVCDLAESICDLEGKICDLADRHEGDERYTDACERAEKHCQRATEACTACAS